jgi:hypothetical protein
MSRISNTRFRTREAPRGSLLPADAHMNSPST